MVYKCQYCGKTYKTEKGFSNHKCEYKDRYESLSTQDYFALWLAFKTVNKLSVNKDVEREKMAFISSSHYKQFVIFSQWCHSIGMLDAVAYFEYLKKYNIPYKLWCSDGSYRKYLILYINSELQPLAIDRSKKFLQDNNLDINTISSNRLYLLMLSGRISKKYLNSINFNYRMYLDRGQLQDLGELG